MDRHSNRNRDDKARIESTTEARDTEQMNLELTSELNSSSASELNHGTFNQNLENVKPTGSAQNSSAQSSLIAEQQANWISAFNTSLLTTRALTVNDQSQEIGRLMSTPEFNSLIVAAQHLARTQNLSEEESTERLIELFRSLDHAWDQIVKKRGLESLIGK
jgi:hypothetical protein